MALRDLCHPTVGFGSPVCLRLPIAAGLTLEGAAGLLSQRQMLLAKVVDGLVLVDLHAGAHVAVSMQEEGEGAGQVLTAEDIQ